jgi:hypothetical protein
MVIQASQSRGHLRLAFCHEFPRETLTPHSTDGEAARKRFLLNATDVWAAWLSKLW